MTDDSWQRALKAWDRVKWARSQMFENAQEAARALGLSGSTYRQYERDPKSSRSANLTEYYAKLFGKKFKVRWEWLLSGAGTPYGDTDDVDADLAELAKMYKHLNGKQRELLVLIAQTMVGSDVDEIDALPKSPAVASHSKHSKG